MSTPVADATYPAPSDLLQTILNAIVFAYVWQGLDEPNVLPGSDHYLRAQAYANQIAIAIANNQISEAESNPLTATGQNLILLAAIFGVSPRPAAPAAGAVTIAASATVTLPSGFIGTTPDGMQFRTVAAPGFPLTVAPGGQVQVVAVASGQASNEATGLKLSWQSAALGALGPQATVAAPGLVGGINADGDDQLRARLLAKLSAPPVGGNASAIEGWAEGATASVEAAFVYSGVRGGSSYDVAVTTPGGTRQLASPTLNVIRSAILAQMPGFADVNVTSVTPNPVDVIIGLDLPLPATASGSGGGWLAAAPWPAEIAKVTGFNSGTGTATVNSVAAPAVGQPIGYWDPTYVDPETDLVTGIMREATVATVGGSSTAWTITLTQGWTISPLNTYLSADAVSLVAYATAFQQGVAVLGPGEKTALPELLPRGARDPSTQSGVWFPNLAHRLLDAIDGSYPEVLDIAYAATYAAGTSTTQTSPNVPGTTADPPGILTLNSVAFIYTAT